MTIKCVIIDDEPLAIKVLEQHLGKIPDLTLIGSFNNPVDALNFLESQKVDLLFLDIQMPLLTGLDYIKNTNIKPKIIFTTAYREYAMEGYELDVIDYLLKPISFPRFLKAINKYKEVYSSSESLINKKNNKLESKSIYVNVNKKHLRIDFDSILYIDSAKDYIRIHTKERSFTTKEKISVFLEKLPSNFIRVHRSYIVNKDKITAFTANDVEIDKIEIPIGNSYKQDIQFLKN